MGRGTARGPDGYACCSQFHVDDLDGLAAEAVRKMPPACAPEAVSSVEGFGVDRGFEADWSAARIDVAEPFRLVGMALEIEPGDEGAARTARIGGRQVSCN